MPSIAVVGYGNRRLAARHGGNVCGASSENRAGARQQLADRAAPIRVPGGSVGMAGRNYPAARNNRGAARRIERWHARLQNRSGLSTGKLQPRPVGTTGLQNVGVRQPR
jgi:hypothetical protein